MISVPACCCALWSSQQVYQYSAYLASAPGLLKGGTIEFTAGFVEAGTGKVRLQLVLVCAGKEQVQEKATPQ
jgi:hypothetical protein